MKIRQLILFLWLPLLALLWCIGCCSEKKDFVGMTREEVAEAFANGPKRKDGSFHVNHRSEPSRDTLVTFFYKSKESLLNSPTAMDAPKWRGYYHLDLNYKWHSYLLEFQNNVVVAQSEYWQPHWVWAEP
jgi:hypothetical protein